MAPLRSLTTLTALLLALAPAAGAQRGDPASLLLFPEYDCGAGTLNLITVTNMDPTPGDSVQVRWEFVDGATCSEANRTVTLQSRDTLTFVASAFLPGAGHGYAYAYAEGAPLEPIVHNLLIGTSTILDGLGHLEYTVEPYSFRARGPAGASTDLNGNGRRDLNGIEYLPVAEEYIFPRFIGQTAQRTSELVLLDLSGGLGYQATAGLLVYNDNSEVFSAQTSFQCWDKVELSSITLAMTNDFLANSTNHDPDEVVGLTTLETGWLRVDGISASGPGGAFADPAILALLIEGTSSGRQGSSHPAFVGTQTNASLAPHGNSPSLP